MNTKITFDESATSFVLDTFGKTTDKAGFIIDKVTGQRELNKQKKPIHVTNFAGFHKELGILEKDLSTVIDLIDLEQANK